MLEVGDQAPDFTLESTRGDFRLSDLFARRKVVLAFYTEDNTPLCSNEVAMFRDDCDVIQELGAEVIGVSADSLESHAAFAVRLGGVPFPLLSDSGLDAARAYGVIDEAGKRSRRAVFVIDVGGLILHVEPWFQPGSPGQYEAIFRALGFEG
jgi:peroxiredoxin Q/BCP